MCALKEKKYLRQQKNICVPLTIQILYGSQQRFQTKRMQFPTFHRMTWKISPIQSLSLLYKSNPWLFMNCFWHLPFTVMFWLVKMVCLPTKFRKLTNKAPPCVSCSLGQAHRKPWFSKKSIEGNISSLRCKYISKPGDTIGFDQLISAQHVLVPQEKGIMTCARIWAVTC